MFEEIRNYGLTVFGGNTTSVLKIIDNSRKNMFFKNLFFEDSEHLLSDYERGRPLVWNTKKYKRKGFWKKKRFA